MATLDETLIAVFKLAAGNPDLDVRIDGASRSPGVGAAGWRADQNVRLSILSVTRQGQDERRNAREGDDVRERIYGNRTLRLQVTIETASQTIAGTAEDLADTIRAGLARSDVEAALAAVDVGVPNCSDVRAVPYRDDHGDWVSAAIFEAVFNFSRRVAGPLVGRIGSVTITGSAESAETHTIGPRTIEAP